LTPEQLEGWLSPPREKAPFAILENLTSIDFPGHEEPISLSLWPAGRVFGLSFELRWEKQNSGFRVWFAGESEPPMDAEELPLPENTAISEESYFLWGPAEVRISRRFSYRALGDGKGHPRLVTRECRDETGALRLVRFQKME
jgi:hypothetical protein